MTRRSRTGFAIRLFVLFAVVAGTFGVGSQEALAQKGKPKAPPSGKIYFKYFPSLIKSFNGDGSGSANALPAAAMNALNSNLGVLAIPTNHVYDGHRWFVTTAVTGHYDEVINLSGGTSLNYPHFDLVAVRQRPGSTTEIDVVQLTDSYGVLTFRSLSAYLSNDSNEVSGTSFIGGFATDIRDSFVVNEDGSTFCNFQNAPHGPVRLPLTMSDVLAPGFEPVDDTWSDEEIDELLWPMVFVSALSPQGTTSPDGSLAVSVKGTSNRLVIVDAAAPDYDNPVRLLWDGNTGSPVWQNAPQWSPDGSSIAFMADDSTNVWTISATGGTPKKVLAGTTTTKYSRPIWSPDSQFVVAVKNSYSGTTVTGTRLVRVPANGGTIVDLGAIGTGTANATLRWVPSN